jgi:hypothetical protein
MEIEEKLMQGTWISMHGFKSQDSKSYSFVISIVPLNMLNFKLLVEDKHKHISDVTNLMTVLKINCFVCT